MIEIKITHNARKYLANNIVFYRIKKGWSQEELAEKLGTSPKYLSSLENAKSNCRIDNIEHISNILDIEIYQLFEKREYSKKKRIPKK